MFVWCIRIGVWGDEISKGGGGGGKIFSQMERRSGGERDKTKMKGQTRDKIVKRRTTEV
jgi:hypothetical protein